MSRLFQHSALRRDLLRQLKAIREPPMRVAKMTSFLRSDPNTVVDVLIDLCASIRSEDSESALALDAMAVSLQGDDAITYADRRNLYDAATERRAPEVARLFFEVTPKSHDIAAIEESLDDDRKLLPSGRPLTLGERKSLARGPRGDTLRQLLSDPHPQVVAVLLENPHLSESDVLLIASRRPTLPACLELVFGHPRWRPRYRIKRALCFNPGCPVPLAARIMTTLRKADLRQIRDDRALSPSLRQHAKDIARRRAVAVYDHYVRRGLQ